MFRPRGLEHLQIPQVDQAKPLEHEMQEKAVVDDKLDKQPAEGSRKVVEEELKRREGERREDRTANDQLSDRGGQDADTLTEGDFGSDKMGNNQLEGDDQTSLQNQRQTAPDEKAEPDDDVIESFEKLDKEARARRDLGKKRE